MRIEDNSVILDIALFYQVTLILLVSFKTHTV